MHDTGSESIQFRLDIPSGYEESLIWQLQAEGWGTAIFEQVFPAGYLDDEPNGRPASGVVVLVVAPGKRADFEQRMEGLAVQFGWASHQWAIQQRVLPETDWENAWKDQWKPFRCAGFVIYPQFWPLQDLSLRENDQALSLYTGSAFGTGGHPSTRLALRVLRKWHRQREFGKVLDVGTGSGILAVAAALLGARFTLGMDPDPPSPSQSRSNAKQNEVAHRCHFWQGTLESVTGKWEVVFANLQSGLLQEYAANLALLLEPKGRLFAGGFMDRNEEKTLSAFENGNLRVLKLHKHGRWRGAELELRMTQGLEVRHE
jgi:ribosomal protein L11 methyltransferase